MDFTPCYYSFYNDVKSNFSSTNINIYILLYKIFDGNTKEFWFDVKLNLWFDVKLYFWFSLYIMVYVLNGNIYMSFVIVIGHRHFDIHQHFHSHHYDIHHHQMVLLSTLDLNTIDN